MKKKLVAQKRLNIAIIGGGIAGMSAAWLLNKKHSVCIYEADDRVGGHTNTVKVFCGKKEQPVDTGFIVFNETNYPNLVKLFDYLKVHTQTSDMSFSVSLKNGNFEYGSRNINALFGQRSNILNFRFWNMLTEILRFFPEVTELAMKNNISSCSTLKEFLNFHNYNSVLIENFILPMGAAIWSTNPSKILEQPANTFLNFFTSHGLLKFRDRFIWKTVSGGSQEYIDKITKDYINRIYLNSNIRTITRSNNKVYIVDQSGDSKIYDAVVIATHADQALQLLDDPSPKEYGLLSKFRYTKNNVVLHSDNELMPKRRRVWSSWNFMGTNVQRVSVTYWMNLLQSIPQKCPLFVSVNPLKEPNNKLIHKTFEYQHPFFDSDTVNAQKELWQLQGERNTWFCGSYFGYGFHEDALQSGLAVAEQLGDLNRPWFNDTHNERIFRNNTDEIKIS